MGYNTDFTGVLKFKKELTASQLVKLKSYLGADCRDHPEWRAPNLTYIKLELTENLDGLRWDGSEKTYSMPEQVDFINQQMRATYPDFELEGQLLAQGEDFDDRWVLKIDEYGRATRQDVVITGTKIECPHCGTKFIIEQQNQ